MRASWVRSTSWCACRTEAFRVRARASPSPSPNPNKARGEATHVDYFGQCGLDGGGGARPPRPTGGGGGCCGAAGGQPPKRAAPRAGAKRAPAPRNEWRTRGGQKVYFDADGKKSTGSEAFRKHAKHQVATKGASSSVAVPASAQDVAAAQAERLRAGAERIAARQGRV